MERDAVIVAGFGFRAAARVESLAEALALASGGRAVTHLAAPGDKAGADSMKGLADRLALPVLAVTPERLRSVETVTRSAKVAEHRGVGSVAEAAALAVLAPGGRLVGTRCVSGDRLASCAIAEGEPA